MNRDVAVAPPRMVAPSRRRNQFHSYAAAALLLIVFTGFAPTLFLRGALSPVPPIPLYLFAHGLIVAGGFVWLLVQSRPAGSGRVATHRRVGTFGAAYAIAVVVAALMATSGAVNRIVADGFDLEADLSTLDGGELGPCLFRSRHGCSSPPCSHTTCGPGAGRAFTRSLG